MKQLANTRRMPLSRDIEVLHKLRNPSYLTSKASYRFNPTSFSIFYHSGMSRPAKRRKTAKVEEIRFDDEARHDYLSGFHKRKLERIKRAQDAAAKKEHAEKLEQRRIVRPFIPTDDCT